MFIFFLFVISVLNQLHAQTDQLLPYVNIETQSETIVGELINISSDSILIYAVDEGLRSFAKKDIAEFHLNLNTSKIGETTNSSVPYYIQSAIPNGVGNHYYKNYFLFGNEFNFGVNDNMNFSAGFETASLIFDSNDQFPVLQAGIKLGSTIVENVHFGISSKYYFNDSDDVLMLSAPLTIGNKRSNFTISPVRMTSDDSVDYGVFTNMSIPLGSKTRFIFDFARISGERIAALLIEYMFNNGFSLSMGGFFTREDAVPNLSFSIPFGKWKNQFNKRAKFR